jgi:hypothetical protein
MSSRCPFLGGTEYAGHQVDHAISDQLELEDEPSIALLSAKAVNLQLSRGCQPASQYHMSVHLKQRALTGSGYRLLRIQQW